MLTAPTLITSRPSKSSQIITNHQNHQITIIITMAAVFASLTPAIFASLTPAQLTATLIYTRFRLVTVLKEKASLRLRLDTADIRVARIKQENSDLAKENQDITTAYQDVVKAYHDLAKKHHDLAQKHQNLVRENQQVVKQSQRVDSCLVKTRAAFLQLKEKNQKLSTELDGFVEMANSLEARLQEAWNIAQGYARELSIVKGQYEQLRCYFGYVQPYAYPS
jgi:DNA repair exonuclease SbcCD ATPase subunit